MNRSDAAAQPSAGGRGTHTMSRTASSLETGVPPNEAATIIAQNWCRLLGRDAIDVANNFFDLGGTSLTAMELSCALTEALSVEVDARAVFANPTLREFTAAMQRALRQPTRLVRSSEEGESWPLLPAQCWFFEQQFARPSHFCIAPIFEMVEFLDIGSLHDAIAIAINHHDALRTQFRAAATGWQQVALGSSDESVVVHHDLSRLTRDEQDTRIAAIGSSIAEAFAIGQNSLVNMATIDLGRDRGQRLLIVGHHLVCDVISSHILIRDIEASYRWLQAGHQRDKPFLAKTTTAKSWARWLNSPDAAADAAADATYWHRPGVTMTLPRDEAGGDGPRRQLLRQTLSPELTAATIRAANKNRTNVDVVLLAAYVRTVADWCQTSDVIIGLNSHGRTPAPPGINLTRTVGWLSRQAPLYVDVSNARTSASLIDTVTYALDCRPRDGLAHSILRFTANRDSGSAGLSDTAPADVSFNYLGSVDAACHDLSLFRNGKEDTGVRHWHENAPTQMLELLCALTRNTMSAVWSFDSQTLSRSTLARLADRFDRSLTAIVSAT